MDTSEVGDEDEEIFIELVSRPRPPVEGKG